MLIFAISGCGNTKNINQLKKSSPATLDSSAEHDKYSQLSFLKQCINNSVELEKINSNYKRENGEVHSLIKEAKLYAAANLSENINKTIAPLLEYKIRYTCNSISQLLIVEFSNRIQKISSSSGETQ